MNFKERLLVIRDEWINNEMQKIIGEIKHKCLEAAQKGERSIKIEHLLDAEDEEAISDALRNEPNCLIVNDSITYTTYNGESHRSARRIISW